MDKYKVGDKVYIRKNFRNITSYYESKIDYVTNRNFYIIDGIPFDSSGQCYANFVDMDNAYYILTEEEYKKQKMENDITNIKKDIIQYLTTSNISLKDLIKLTELLEIKHKTIDDCVYQEGGWN